MKFILPFVNFYNEAIFTPQPGDPEEITSKINRLNNLDKWIKDFPTQKNQISNIFNTFKDENDKFSKLKPFLTDTSNIKKMQFKNELLGMWAEICSFNRQIADIDKNIKDKSTEITDVKKSVNVTDQISKQMGQENIDTLKQNIQNTDTLKKDLESQILRKNKEVQDRLLKYKKELEGGKKELDIYNQQKLRKI